MFSRLARSKTFWAALSAILIAAEQVVTGQSTLIDAMQIVIPAVLAIFVRDGIAKSANP